jgi:ADP-ribosylglycohydrolase
MFSDAELSRRMMGCWLGKAVGGTLGMPYEGVRETVALTYYDPVPTEMLPNDDLDAQVVYAYLLDQMDRPRVDRHVLSKAWDHIGMSADEYGICKRNLKLGLVPPMTGSYDNPFTAGMGAAIRTEIWACLAPGQPDVAAAYAYEDACMDHANEGIHAAIFVAVLQSLAFVESNTDKLLDAALDYLPADSQVRLAVVDTRRWWDETRDWAIVQRRLSDRYMNDNFTDVVINIAYVVLGWLAGEGKFGPSICAAVNGGQDTDCTGATLGALLGILNPEGIDESWLAPIGRELVLSPSVSGVKHPPTLDGFTDQVMSLRKRLACRLPAVDEIRQPTEHLAIRADVAFDDDKDMPSLQIAPSLPGSAKPMLLSGQYQQWPASEVKGKRLWLRYRLTLSESGPVQVMCSTRQPMRLWIDGKGLLAGDGNTPFIPAMHRSPKEHHTVVNLSAGSHELVLLLRRPDEDLPLMWCVGLSDVKASPVCQDWLVDVFDRPGLRRINADVNASAEADSPAIVSHR